MGRVLGIGGVFYRCEDPEGVRDWYRRVLGVQWSQWGSADFAPRDQAMTVLSPFKADTDYFAPSTAAFMINLAVEDLDGLLKQAKAQGVEPLGRQDESYGKFAWLMDPQGIKIELWEPGEMPA